MTHPVNETIMDYRGFLTKSDYNSLSPLNEIDFKPFKKGAATPGFNTTTNHKPNRTVCHLGELEKGHTDRLCPTTDSVRRADETPFQLSKKVAHLSDSLASVSNLFSKLTDQLDQMKEELSARPTRTELESHLLLKANKQSVANALQRKANRNDIESLSKMVITLTNMTNSDSHLLDEAKSSLEQDLNRKMHSAQAAVEDGLRKQLSRDMQRLNGEILNLNTIITKLTVESRGSEERV